MDLKRFAITYNYTTELFTKVTSSSTIFKENSLFFEETQAMLFKYIAHKFIHYVINFNKYFKTFCSDRLSFQVRLTAVTSGNLNQ